MALHLPLAIGLPGTPGHLPSGGSAVDERELGGKNSQGNRVGSGDREASVGMDPATEGAALTSLTRAFSLSVRPRCLDPRGGSAPEQWLEGAYPLVLEQIFAQEKPTPAIVRYP